MSAAEPSFTPPKVIVLKTTEGEQVGFMLTSMHASAGTSDFEGECVFSLMPTNTAVIESELGVITSELKMAGEHPCRMKLSDDKSEIWVTPKELPSLTLTFDAKGDGVISTTEQGKTRNVGKALLMKK
jgi:hypothetical protein